MHATALRPQSGPYVEFDTRAEEDRTETLKRGSVFMKDVDYAIIRALGAKDAVERPALDWLEHIEAQSRKGSYDPKLVTFYKEQYKAWKAGLEAPVNGTHVKNWPGTSPAIVSMLIAQGIRTVEDVALANEETLGRLGMGSRGLKQRAQAWLDSAQQNGVAAEELALLREQNALQKERLDRLEAQNADQQRDIATLISKLEGDDGTDAAPKKKR